jgi:hypothetical protein
MNKGGWNKKNLELLMGTQRFGKKKVMHIFFLGFLTYFFGKEAGELWL